MENGYQASDKEGVTVQSQIVIRNYITSIIYKLKNSCYSDDMKSRDAFKKTKMIMRLE